MQICHGGGPSAAPTAETTNPVKAAKNARPRGQKMTIALATVWVLGSFALVMAAMFAVPAEG